MLLYASVGAGTTDGAGGSAIEVEEFAGSILLNFGKNERD